MSTSNNSLKKIFLILVLFFIGQTSFAEDIKIGIEPEELYTTLRAQSLSGKWQIQLYKESEKGTTLTSEEIHTGEDIVLMLIPKGIIARISSERMIETGFDKVTLIGGDLINLELPRTSPKLLQGKVEITHNKQYMNIVNTLPIRDYTVSCVSAELISCEPEAVKAHIIALESKIHYLKANSRHEKEDYSLCDGKHCVEYRGKGLNRELVELLYPTIPQHLLFYKNKLIYPRYHDTCGGKISSAKDVYGVDDEPYHVAQNDLKEGTGSENCFHSPSFHWTIEAPISSFEDFLSMEFAGGADNIYLNSEPLKISKEGRILMLRLKGRKIKEIQGTEFLKHLQNYYGKNSVKSMRHTMEPLKRTLLIRGMGEGDGVGMCLYGADGLAKKGSTYLQILNFYYPGTNIK